MIGISIVQTVQVQVEAGYHKQSSAANSAWKMQGASSMLSQLISMLSQQRQLHKQKNKFQLIWHAKAQL